MSVISPKFSNQIEAVSRQRLILLFFLLASLAYLFIEANGDGDLYIYLQASGRLAAGDDIYVTKYIDTQYHYYYSVAFALLLQPFYSLSFYWVKFSWLVLNYGLFIHLLFLFRNSDLIGRLPQFKGQLVFWGTALFAFRFVHENIHASQITILIFWCTVMALKFAYQQQHLKAGLLLAIGINLKLLPLLLLPYLIYRANFKTVFYTITFVLILYVLPAVFIGMEYNTHLLKSWWLLVNPDQPRHILDVDERSFHSLSTLLATLLVKEVPDFYALTIKRNVLDLSYQTVATVLLTVRLLLLSLLMFFVRSLPFKTCISGRQYLFETSYILLLIPLLFPHQQHYAFLFAVPAFALSLLTIVENPAAWSGAKQATVWFFLAVIYLTGNLKILLGEFNRYYEHFKILSYGALLLIPLLMVCYQAQRISARQE